MADRGREKTFHSGKVEFRGPGGRQVFLERLVLEYSYLGSLEGNPETINAWHLQRLPDTVSRYLTPDTPWVLIPPNMQPGEPLPAFLAIAEFMSDSVRAPYCLSALAVVWYSDSFRALLADHIEVILESVDWNANARDYDP